MFEKDEIKRRMQGAIDLLCKEFSGLRAGRASVSLLEPIRVDAYGSLVMLSQVANVTAPEVRMLNVQVWDKNLVKVVEKAIRDSGIGVNPISEGSTIRVPLPELTEARRKDLCKMAAKYSEDARISIRNVRRDAMDTLKRLEKDKHISEDEHKKKSTEIQKITDNFIGQIDELGAKKQKDIMHV